MAAGGAGEAGRLAAGADGRWRLAGALTLATVGGLWGEGVERLAGLGGRLELDLGGVERSDSAGLALLVAWMGEARRRGIELEVRNLPGQMRAIAAASGLEGLLERR